MSRRGVSHASNGAWQVGRITLLECRTRAPAWCGVGIHIDDGPDDIPDVGDLQRQLLNISSVVLSQQGGLQRNFLFVNPKKEHGPIRCV